MQVLCSMWHNQLTQSGDRITSSQRPMINTMSPATSPDPESLIYVTSLTPCLQLYAEQNQITSIVLGKELQSILDKCLHFSVTSLIQPPINDNLPQRFIVEASPMQGWWKH